MLSYEWQELEKKGDDTSPLVLLVQYEPGKARSLVDRLLHCQIEEHRGAKNADNAFHRFHKEDSLELAVIAERPCLTMMHPEL